jgi:opacity protein-like surface antigen
MKKSVDLLVLSSLILLFMVRASSQVHFALGPKFGLNLGTVSYDPDVTNKSGRTAMMFGATAELMFGKMFGIQIEPGYAMKGNKFEGQIPLTDQNGTPLGNATISITRALNEIQIPILFKVKFLDGSVKPYAMLGPNIGIVASANDNFNITNIPQGVQLQQSSGDIDQKANTSGLDFGLDIGSGTEIALTKQVALTGDIRYSLGFSNLIKNAVGTASAKSRGFQIQFGALFSL